MFRYQAVLVIGVILLNGCAAIMHGTKQGISINSVPSGANVSVAGVSKAMTPAVVDLKRNQECVVKIEKEGYEPVEMAISRSVDGMIFGNIIFGGLIGLAVDFGTGAAYKLKPDAISVNLSKKETIAPVVPQTQNDDMVGTSIEK